MSRPTAHLARHQWIYEQHFGLHRTYIDIAADLGVSAARAREMALRWQREVDYILLPTCPTCGQKVLPKRRTEI